MSESDQTAWAIQALKDLRSDSNEFTIDNVIQVLQDQQAEIESLRGSMEGQLWSPTSWHADQQAQQKTK